MEYLPLKKLKTLASNPRTIKDDAFKMLCASINDNPKYFEARPLILSNRTGELIIIAGNQRYAAAKHLALKEVPCYLMENLTEEKEREITIKDNLHVGEWNYDILANEFEQSELLEWGFNELKSISQAGEPIDAEAQVDQAKEINKKWKLKAGDMWQIGKHRLLCGDSGDKKNIEKLMQKEKATLCFTDPPYGVSIGKKNVMLNSFQKAGRNLTDIESDDMKPEELKIILKNVFTSWRPYFADDCSVFVCSPQGGGLGMMMMMMQESCLEVRHIINWVKNSPTFSMGRLDYDYQHEPILFTWIKTHKRKKEGQFQTSLWAVNKPMANKEHPTMKPVELPINAILNHTDKNDIVVDMFGGSGTTMLAAENTERVCYMSELSPNYCAVIIERMKTAFPNIEIKKNK